MHQVPEVSALVLLTAVREPAPFCVCLAGNAAPLGVGDCVPHGLIVLVATGSAAGLLLELTTLDHDEVVAATVLLTVVRVPALTAFALSLAGNLTPLSVRDAAPVVFGTSINKLKALGAISSRHIFLNYIPKNY